MTVRSVTARIGADIAAVKEWRDAIVKQSAQDVVRRMQTPESKGGRNKVDTGFHRNSLASKLNGGKVVKRGGTDAEGGRPDSYRLVLNEYTFEDTAEFYYTAPYSAVLEYGRLDGSRKGAFFVEDATNQYPRYVRKNVRRLRGRIRRSR